MMWSASLWLCVVAVRWSGHVFFSTCQIRNQEGHTYELRTMVETTWGSVRSIQHNTLEIL